jgi:hypothetical protein
MEPNDSNLQYYHISDTQHLAVSAHRTDSPKLYTRAAKYCEESGQNFQRFCCPFAEPFNSVHYSKLHKYQHLKTLKRKSISMSLCVTWTGGRLRTAGCYRGDKLLMGFDICGTGHKMAAYRGKGSKGVQLSSTKKCKSACWRYVITVCMASPEHKIRQTDRKVVCLSLGFSANTNMQSNRAPLTLSLPN